MELFSLKKHSNSSKEYVWVPESLYTPFNHFKTISLGTEICNCEIKRSKEPQTIYITESLWKQLGIPYESKIHVIANDGVLHLGPLIGIFTAGFTGTTIRPIGDRSLFFAKLLSTEKTVGAFTFVFGANHINWETGRIKGFFHSMDGWKQIEVPFPNVVYDRLPNRKTENHSILKNIKNKLQNEYLIPWFNPGFFNKWEIHEIFSAHPEVTLYLPETIAIPTLNSIRELLDKYHNIYIKPMNGSLGLGIHQIIKAADSDGEALYCRFRKNDKNHLRKFKSLESLLQTQFNNENLKGYIAQQGIALIKVDNKPFDFRIHTNKDDAGVWKMSAIAAKVAGVGSVTTHLGSGGIVKTIEEIKKLVPIPADGAEKLEQAVLTMSEILEKEINGTLGEIGFDLGIDKNGQIWVFEANSKPGRSIFKHPKLKEYDQLSRALPMSFAIYLTKRAILEPEVLFHEKE
ncbi:MAG TPA: YheC/YheD family protein [Bacillus bacterium]|nr:YheC/YheD family protein [Bacillus sp. (in: firmicutes)]